MSEFEGVDNSAKLGFEIGDDYQELKEKEFEFGEPEIDKSLFQLIETIDPTVIISKKKSGSGCMLIVTLMLGFFVLIISLQE